MKKLKNWNIIYLLKMIKYLINKTQKISNRNDNENCRPQNSNNRSMTNKKFLKKAKNKNTQYINTIHFSNFDVSSITRKANLFKGCKEVKHIINH